MTDSPRQSVCARQGTVIGSSKTNIARGSARQTKPNKRWSRNGSDDTDAIKPKTTAGLTRNDNESSQRSHGRPGGALPAGKARQRATGRPKHDGKPNNAGLPHHAGLPNTRLLALA